MPLRYKGKFISKTFEQLITEALKPSGRDPQKFLDNPDNFAKIDSLLEGTKQTLFVTEGGLFRDTFENDKEYITVVIDGEEKRMAVGEAMLMLMEFNRILKSQDESIVYVGVREELYLNGTIKIFLPNVDDPESIEEFIQSGNSEIITSDHP